jgi:hypothetical protein
MEPSSPFQGNIPGAPPPPPEVKVRTMHSDLESMARSGGGAPQFENVAVAGLAAQQNQAAVSVTNATTPGQPQSAAVAGGAPAKSIIGAILVAVVAIVALAVVGYFAYTIFLSSPANKTPPSAVATSTNP